MIDVSRIFALFLMMAIAASLMAQDTGSKTSARFHSGAVLAAELLPESAGIPVAVKNVSPFEPPSRITSDVAYAAVTVRLDSGRSLSVYDYVLVNRRKDEFKCIGIRENDGDYDYEKWEFPATRPDRLYTLLFKVQLPSFNETASYSLRYALNKSRIEETPIPFIRTVSPFTSPSKIPAGGILGVDPNVKPAPAKEDAAKVADAGQVGASEEARKPAASTGKSEAATVGPVKVIKPAKWCTLSFPEKVAVGQVMEVKVKIAGLKSPTKLCADLHFRTVGKAYGGIYAVGAPQPISADGEFTFKFDIKDKDNLESVSLLVFQSSTGSFDDQKVSVTGPDIMVSGATRVAVKEKPTMKELGVDADGYIRAWLALPPIQLKSNISSHSEKVLGPFVKKQFFPDQNKATPADNDKVNVDGSELVWKAHLSEDAAWIFDSPPENSLYLVVTYVYAEQDVNDVILSIGSDDSSVWTVNGAEAIKVYKGRGLERDSDKSQPLTLKKGRNVVRVMLFNGQGSAGICARFLDKNGSAVQNLRASPNPSAK